MWVVRGSLLGLLIFAAIFAIRFHKLFHAIVTPAVVRSVTIHSAAFWVGLIGSVLVGCTIVWYWTPKVH